MGLGSAPVACAACIKWRERRVKILFSKRYFLFFQEVTLTIDHCKHADIIENDEKIVEKRENCEVVIKTERNYE